MNDKRVALAAKTALLSLLASTLCSGLFLLDIGSRNAPVAWALALWTGVVAFAAGGYVFLAYLRHGLGVLRAGSSAGAVGAAVS
jgi:hypothetical protein